MKRSFFRIIWLMLLPAILSFYASGQTVKGTFQPTDPLIGKADSLFSHENYSEAATLYRQLLDSYPHDYKIHYKLGICLLHRKSELHNALSHLKLASEGEVPNNVHYYLAEALRLSYRFDEAISYYRRFTVNGGDSEHSTDEIEQRVSLCENGLFLTRYIYSPTLFDSKTLPIGDFYTYYSITPKNGNFVPLPKELLSPADKRKNNRSILFFPEKPQPGTYLYFSSYGNSTSFGRDIFRIKFLPNGKWGEPENLGDIVNTPFDEDFPYIMPDGVTLFFASKGHYGMGGYDIYKTVYNPQTQQWSSPENLGFPINSPFDDFLYVASPHDSLALFATNRTCSDDNVTLVLLKHQLNPIRHTPKSPDEIRNLASLTPNPPKQLNSPKKSNSTTHKPTPPARFSSVENDPEYTRVIAKGFAAQALADSLKEKLEKLRQKFDYVYTAQQRIRLEKKVEKAEDAMLAAQKQADLMFVRASQIEQEYLTGKRKPSGKNNPSFATDNPHFTYQAQFAKTVFRSDELVKLSKAEKLSNRLKLTREKALAARNHYNDCLDKYGVDSLCQKEYKTMLAAQKSYNKLMASYFAIKYPIYNACIDVAYVKSGSNDQSIRETVKLAQSHFRAANIIINNIDDNGKIESTFEASLLRELGLSRIDLAFAKTWNLTLYEQRLRSKIIKLERAIFGSTELDEPTPSAPKPNNPQPKRVRPTIEKHSNQSKTVDIKISANAPKAEFGQASPAKSDSKHTIAIDEELPSGILYKIQIGAFSKPRTLRFFKGFYPITGKRVGRITKYYIGKFYRLSDAEQALSKVKTKGFKDAFIVAWNNGKPLPPQRAKTLENATVSYQPKKQAPAQTGTFIIQLGIYEGKIPESELRTVKALAPDKELLRKTDLRGFYIYSVGYFNNADEAERIKDNLVASGLLKASVIQLNN